MMNEQRKDAIARRRLSVIEGFYVHAGIFVMAMLVLTALDLAVGDSLWFYWVLLGWGAGLLLHAGLVFGRAPDALARWESRKLAEIKRGLDAQGNGASKS
jgi:hypothetical protein